MPSILGADLAHWLDIASTRLRAHATRPRGPVAKISWSFFVVLGFAWASADLPAGSDDVASDAWLVASGTATAIGTVTPATCDESLQRAPSAPTLFAALTCPPKNGPVED